MSTIFRLLIIAGLISYIRGPFKTTHPAAYQEGVDTLKTIPHLIGQMLTNELALLPQKSPSPSLNGASTKEDPSKTTPSASQPLSILSDLLKVVEGATTGGNSNANSNQSTLWSDLSKGVIGLPTSGALGDLQITGLSHQEAGQLIGHLRTLDLVQVVPKLENLSMELRQIAQTSPSASAPLRSAEQKKMVSAYQQTIDVLKINPSFSIEQGKKQTRPVPISFAQLLNQSNLLKDKVTVQINDQSHHQLAQFTVSFHQATPSTPVLSQNTKSHPF